MGFKKEEIANITEQVIQEFAEIEASFGETVSDEATRAIKFAVASTLAKATPF